MSATNRGAERQPFDNYPTPAWCVKRLLEAVPLPGGVWLEPAVGDGAIIRAVEANAEGSRFLRWHFMDLRPEAVEFTNAAGQPMSNPYDGLNIGAGDYLSTKLVASPAEKFTVAITNPPFSQALRFAKKMTHDARWAVLLLRLNFAGSGNRDGRPQWLRENPPDVYVLPQRPSFCQSLSCKAESCDWRETIPALAQARKSCPQCGSKVQRSASDASEYAWFVWTPVTHEHSSGSFNVLADTSEEERALG